MKQQGSNFVTPACIVLLVLLFFVAAYFSITGLEALIAALLLLSLTAYFWSRYALRKLHITAEKPESRGFPGETQAVTLTLCNDKYLPLIWLETAFPLKDCIRLPDAAADGDSLKERFLWIMPRQSITWTQKAVGTKRGVARYDHLTLSSGDGFGLSSLTAEIPSAAAIRFVVYPKIHDVSLSPITRCLRELEQHPQGYYQDPTLIDSIRDYQPGDSIRSINWRQLARTDKLAVNVHASITMNRFCLIPDLVSYTYKTSEKQGDVERVVTKLHEDKLEEMLSMLASIVVAAQEKKLLCSLVLPGFSDTPARIITPETADTQVIELLTALAELDYHGEPVTFPVYEMEDKAHLLGRYFLFSKKTQSADALEALSPIHVVHEPGGIAASGTNIAWKELMP